MRPLRIIQLSNPLSYNLSTTGIRRSTRLTISSLPLTMTKVNAKQNVSLQKGQNRYLEKTLQFGRLIQQFELQLWVILEKAISLFHVKHRALTQKQRVTTTSFVASTSPLDSARPNGYPRMHDQQHGCACYLPSRTNSRMQQTGPTWSQHFPPNSRAVQLPSPPPRGTISHPHPANEDHYPAYPPKPRYSRNRDSCPPKPRYSRNRTL